MSGALSLLLKEAVQAGEDRPDRGPGDVGGYAYPVGGPADLYVHHVDVGRGLGVGSRLKGVLLVVQDADLDPRLLQKSSLDGVQGPLPAAWMEAYSPWSE